MPYEEIFSEMFPASEAISVQIEHSHGNVEVQGWDKQELKLDGEKIVQAKTEDLAREYASQMKVEITQESDRIYVKTVRQKLSSQESRRFKIKELTINYTLMGTTKQRYQNRHRLNKCENENTTRWRTENLMRHSICTQNPLFMGV